jgi:hypothetical protein
MKAVFLLAGASERFKGIVEHKCLLQLCGQTLLERLILQVASQGVTSYVFAVGAARHAVMAEVNRIFGNYSMTYREIALVVNDQYRVTGNAHTLWLCKEHLRYETILCEGDVVFDELPPFDALRSRWLTVCGYQGEGCYVPRGPVGAYVIAEEPVDDWEKSAGVFYLTPRGAWLLRKLLERKPASAACVDEVLTGVGLATLSVPVASWHEMDDVGDFEEAKEKIVRPVYYLPDPVLV